MRSFARRLPRSVRSFARSLLVGLGGLPHSTGTVDSPTPEAAGDITQLWARNLRSREPLIDPSADEVVSLTTHGQRVSTVWLTIESIGRGAAKPKRIMLWLDESLERVPRKLRRSIKRGLEIRKAIPGLGPYTKFWPYLSSEPVSGPLVICDDDIIYPDYWLQRMRARHQADPEVVVVHRAHRIVMDSVAGFRPYRGWAPCLTTEPRYDNFGTGVSGQLLPTGLQLELVSRGSAFSTVAPQADDVWLNYVAVETGYKTAQVSAGPEHWAFVPGSQSTALNTSNVWSDANDPQLLATHTDSSRARVWSDAQDTPEGRSGSEAG